MSTFGGIMAEYSQVVIDRFAGSLNMKATAYFLSHAHTDHMQGLGSMTFSKRLKHSFPNVHLYCSDVTKLLLLKDSKYQHLEPYIACLPIDQPTTIITDNERKDETLIVTLLSAGHCPGSVMFLFEGCNGVVLYTGDFRLSKGDAALIGQLHSGSSVKDIKCIYADTTFCTPMAMHIPSREESLGCLMDLVGSHISRSDQHQVKLTCKAKYGYEYLFVELSKAFRMKIHVSSYMMMHYQMVPELAHHMTSDGRSTQIHACAYTKCSVTDSVNTIVVKPSTMWFTSNAQPDEILTKVSDEYYRLCFSFHSSYSEIRDFIGYLKPWKVKANVIPMGCTEQEIINRLSDLLRIPDNMPNQSTPRNPEQGYKPLGSLKKKVIKRKRQNENNTSADYGTLFEETRPRIKKKKSRTQPVTGMKDNGDVTSRSPQYSHDQVDDAISETGSDKVMKYGWQHFIDSLQGGLSTDDEDEDDEEERHCDLHVDTLQGDDEETKNDNDKDFNSHKHCMKYDVDSKKCKPKKDYESDSNNKVSDWLRYLPSSFSGNVDKKSCPNEKYKIVEIREQRRKKKNNVMNAQLMGETRKAGEKNIFEKKRSDRENSPLEGENQKTRENFQIIAKHKEECVTGHLDHQEFKSTCFAPTTKIENDSQKTENYSFSDHGVKHGDTDVSTDMMPLEKQISEKKTVALFCNTTPSTIDNPPFENRDKIIYKPNDSEPKRVDFPPKIAEDLMSDDDSTRMSENKDKIISKPNDSEPKRVDLLPKIAEDLTSDDDSTHVSGQLSQGASDIPGTPDSKSNPMNAICSVKNKGLTVSRVYRMSNSSRFIDRLQKH